jgi:hypothetical protein
VKERARTWLWLIAILFSFLLAIPLGAPGRWPQTQNGGTTGSTVPAPLVTDVGRLRRVIVMTPGEEMRRMTLLASGD